MRLIGRSALVATGMAIASAAIAQTVADNQLPDTGLNIPSNLQIFGKFDPNVRKPTAIVNDAVITGTDVDHRVALIIAANNVKPTDEERERLRRQVLSGLIDETLQIQEAKAAEVTITKEEIDRGFSGVARSFNKPVPELKIYLRAIGSSERSLRRQIEAELAWSRYLRRKVEPFINVGDTEVEGILKRLQANQGSEEFHVKEIYLTATAEREQQVVSEARALMGTIQRGEKPFEQVALERSEATTRAVGGDLGWVRAGQLPETLAQAAVEMKVNQLAGPVPVPGGYSILYLVDTRKVGTADSRDAVLNLRQISMAFKTGITQAEATEKVAAFAKMTQGIKGCGDVAQAAAAFGAEVVDNDAVRVRDLPPQLQDLMLALQIGESTPPFGSPTDGVRALVLCGRDDPKSAALPSMEQVRSQMEQRGVNLRADHKLRDLRRDAVVEYR
ncbi:MAG: peptidylprolyl isomerase [Sphingomonas sp. 32-62-10]|nr:MAG: peptidylprolyl isomerase [Sphingomonas sp. 12-62-6]OYX36675.1 MAG: peptidylprolyl isomerase [Sphingomonas sp. 32-62-10]OYY67170.1 MAG: peptidylprolyl isomerase [Sphingomonas sp. 28-62-11]